MMIQRRTEWIRSMSAAALAVLLIFGMSMAAYSQQRRTAKPAPLKPAVGSIFGQGYQRGYGSGFTQGLNDWHRGVPRDWQNSGGYQQRENSYDARYRNSQEYSQGFELGFEIGHTDGYYGRARNPALPTNALVLAKAAAMADAQRAREQRDQQQQQQQQEQQRPTRSRHTGPPDIAADTELRIRLTTPIDTKQNRVGDSFSAEVIMPAAYEGATVTGHIAALNRSGRVSGKTELSLTFDSITLSDGRSGPLKADLVKVIESESVKKVDAEGQVESGSRTNDSAVRGGVGATAGAIIGGIAGGAKGAILGAIIGGAAGVGTVYVEGNKDLVMERGTEMVIRTAGRRDR
ncbi:MAG TPA: hypothetical protein VGV87_12130 [Blastocatellia bacterium]|jgi:hypothetical protein|nr:hypothetical protein [Blastocatellia bacterium]